MYIAIKNTEHKGVYNKADFKKEWRVKGASIRNFKEDELEAALKWAEVKGIKSNQTVKNNNQTNILTSDTLSPNDFYNTILDYKKYGADAVCICTKNYGELLLKLSRVSLFASNMEFDDDIDLVAQTETQLFKKYSWHTPVYVVYNLDQLSSFDFIGRSVLQIKDFYNRDYAPDLFEQKTLSISSIYSLPGHSDNLLELNEDWLSLNVNDIISIQELFFTIPNIGYSFNPAFGSELKLHELIYPKEVKKLKHITEQNDFENFHIINL